MNPNESEQFKWLLCPVCGSKTRIKMRSDTELRNFPLFCPKCKQEMIICVKDYNVLVIKEPDAQTQSR
ncbi:conjugal transfer protein [Parablautia intestinalis]|uniref:Conjugal transfer protein n=1 Tax=Parablautia intestinalis TaxID=2320100 RepID=A0A3A9A625_9FIRM|nr:cysteine-rich KTR domain-containing protein [Parablautia intestinalis]RKI86939.1 conjugal transfer protein [Parablautia intestinalis]